MFKRPAFILAGLLLMAIIGFAYPMTGATHVSAQGGGPNTGPAPHQANVPIAPAGAFGRAVVNSDGTLARGRYVVTTRRSPDGTGRYEVIFNTNIRNCTYLATIGLAGSQGIEQPGEISVVGAFDDVRGVYVTTSDSTGTFADRGFHLLVSC